MDVTENLYRGLQLQYHWLLADNIFCRVTKHNDMLSLEHEFRILLNVEESLRLQKRRNERILNCALVYRILHHPSLLIIQSEILHLVILCNHSLIHEFELLFIRLYFRYFAFDLSVKSSH
jgi:hypothetical protein